MKLNTHDVPTLITLNACLLERDSLQNTQAHTSKRLAVRFGRASAAHSPPGCNWPRGRMRRRRRRASNRFGFHLNSGGERKLNHICAGGARAGLGRIQAFRLESRVQTCNGRPTYEQMTSAVPRWRSHPVMAMSEESPSFLPLERVFQFSTQSR